MSRSLSHPQKATQTRRRTAAGLPIFRLPRCFFGLALVAMLAAETCPSATAQLPPQAPAQTRSKTLNPGISGPPATRAPVAGTAAEARPVNSLETQPRIQPSGRPSPLPTSTVQRRVDLRTGGLQSLPPIQALPLQSNGDSFFPGALRSPAYCDSETLRKSATIRSLRFWDTRIGVAVGDHGSILLTHDAGKTWKAATTESECRLNDAFWLDARRVIAVGGGVDVVTGISRGSILYSQDGGQTWRSLGDPELPCLRSLHRQGDADHKGTRSKFTLIAEGDPDPISGATHFESRDGGRNWQAVLDPSTSNSNASSERPVNAERSAQWCSITGARCVIRAWDSLDDQTLLCAGDHGTILRSTDRGKTWKPVRGPGRTAVLIVATKPQEIPWSLIGRESLEKRLRTNIVVGVTGPNTNGPHTNGRDAKKIQPKLDQAAMHLGASAIDISAELSSESLSQKNNEGIKTIKRWIDVHRPPVVAIDSRWPANVKSAITQFAVSLGTEKVVEYSTRDRGETLFHDAALLPKSGTLAGDFADDSQLVLGDFRQSLSLGRSPSGHSDGVSITTLYSTAGSREGGASLADGARLSAEHRLPSRRSIASRRRLQVVQGRLKQRSTIDELFRTAPPLADQDAKQQFAASLELLIDQTSHVDQFRAAWKIVRRSLGTSHEPLAWQVLANRFGAASAGRLAALHGQAREHSKEWNHYGWLPEDISPLPGRPSQDLSLESASGEMPTSQPESELLPTGAGHAALVSPFQTPEQAGAETQRSVIQASAALPLLGKTVPGATPTPRGQGQGELDLAWQMHPVRLLVDDAFNRGEIEQAIQQAALEATDAASPDPKGTQLADPTVSADLQRIADRKTAWSALLQSDSDRVAVAPKLDHPPRLDGRLNESIWNPRHCKPALISGNKPVSLSCAWDDRFVYLAVVSRGSDFQMPTTSVEELGRRDADLIASDRIRLAVDTDRDLLTAFRVAFTRDGRTHDDLDGNRNWNPTWYVASHRQGDQITSEIAIERQALANQIQKGDRWLLRCELLRSGDRGAREVMPNPNDRIRIEFR